MKVSKNISGLYTKYWVSVACKTKSHCRVKYQKNSVLMYLNHN